MKALSFFMLFAFFIVSSFLSVSIAYGSRRSMYINSRVVEAPVPAYNVEIDGSASKASHVDLGFKAAQDNSKKVFGEWVPISPTDNEVVEVAEFAVLEHNKLAKSNLKFKRVINGTTQVMGGTLYRLIIAAAGNDNQLRDYLALVYVKPWQKFVKNLIKFTQV